MDTRWGKVQWGPHGERKRTSEANWKLPLRWAKAANGKRPRVFCASLADVFDNQVPLEWRGDLFDLIAATPELNWLLLTKRPQNLTRMFPTGWWGNVWLGTTCEDQERYLERWSILSGMRNVPVRFISYEPALGRLAIRAADCRPDWIICGGESGHGARHMHPDWARYVRDDCQKFGVAFFMKQMTGKTAIPDDLLIREFPSAHQ